MKITVTRAARAGLLRMGLKDGRWLRLSVEPGGCAGLKYGAALADKPLRTDRVVYRAGGVRIAAPPGQARHLDGLKIDLSGDLIRPGFVLTNSKARGGCGCGASFGGRKGGCGG